MRDEQFIKISAMILSIIGLLILFAANQIYSPKITKISDISFRDLGNYVRVQGEVLNVRFSNGNLFLDLGDSSRIIKVVHFRYTGSEIKKGDKIEVYGRVNTFKGVLQINSEKIVLKN